MESLEVERTVSELASLTGASVVALHAIEPIDPGGEQEPYQRFYQSEGAS